MYSVFLQKQAEDFLKKLDNFQKSIILKKLEELKSNPELGKPLTGQFAGLRSLRIGIYRVLYDLIEDKLIISVIRIGHRKNVYE